MADAVTARTLVTKTSGGKRATLAFTNLSDGTGESAAQKVDISTLDGNPSKIRIIRLWYSIYGMVVRVLVDHGTDDTVLLLAGVGKFDFESVGGITDPESAGGTGDILFTTVNAIANDSYTIIMEIAWD